MSYRWICFGAIAASLACSTHDVGMDNNRVLGPNVVTDLNESDSAFIGEVSGFAALDNGQFVIADRRNGVLHIYSGDGDRLTGIGRRGEGPGEWSSGPGLLTPIGSAAVAVGDGPFVRVLDVPDGTLRWSYRRAGPGSTVLTSMDADLLLSRYDPATRTTLESVSEDASARSGGPFPELLSENQLVGAFFSAMAGSAVAPDTVLLAVQSSNHLFWGAFPSGPFDSLYTGPVRRRGAMPDLLEQVTPDRPDIGEQALYKPSYPVLVSALSDSRYILIVHSDNEMAMGRMTGQLFMTLVDRNDRSICSDIRLDVPTDPLPYSALRDDTLFVATQVERESSEDSAVILGFHIYPDMCKWDKVRKGS